MSNTNFTGEFAKLPRRIQSRIKQTLLAFQRKSNFYSIFEIVTFDIRQLINIKKISIMYRYRGEVFQIVGNGEQPMNCLETILLHISKNIKSLDNNRIEEPSKLWRASDDVDILLGIPQPPSPVKLNIDVGTATAEEMSELLQELSTLYRMCGGSGLSYEFLESRKQEEKAEVKA